LNINTLTETRKGKEEKTEKKEGKEEGKEGVKPKASEGNRK
jgi:hypothetical protein